MRILHVITRMDRGGSAVNTLICGTEQQRMGHRVVLAYGPSLESDMSEAEQAVLDTEVRAFEALGGQVVLLRFMLRSLGWHDWRAHDELKALLGKGFDVLHTHTSKTGALGRLAAIGLPVKVVHTPHGHIFHGYFGRLKTAIFIAIERHLAKHSDALIALTQAERDDHLDLAIGEAAQWRVIPSGVDVDTIANVMQQSNRSIQWQAVSVGRLVPIKGMERLIAAWAVVCQRQPDARLAIVGDGEEKQSLQALSRDYGIEKQVFFAGWTDPLPYLAASECFVLLSHNEGMGRVVVEAMAAGLPCVVSDVCGLKELVNTQVGYVVDAENPKQVADVLLNQWSDKVRDAARARAQNYSVAAMLNGLEKVYEDVCA